MANIHRGDRVMVLTGKDRGARGTVARMDLKHDRLIVEGVNMGVRHVKPRPPLVQGGRLEQERPLHVSNVMLICPKCGRPTRVGHHFLENGNRVRACKKCNENIE